MAERRNYRRRALVWCRVVQWLMTENANVVMTIDQIVVQRILRRLASIGLVKSDDGQWRPTAVFTHPVELIPVKG